MSVKVSPAFVKDSVSQRPGTMDYLTLKPGSMDYLTSAKPTSLDYFSAYASMLDRTRMYFQSLPQVRPFEGRVATAADLAPLLAGGREREIPLDLSMGTIRQTPDSTAVDDDVIVLEHKKAAAAAAAGARAHALSKLQAEAARHGARLSDAFLPPVGATFPHSAKKACQHNGVTPTLSGMMPNPLGAFSCSQTSTASAGVTVSQAGTDALVTHLPGHLSLLSHPVHSAGTCSSDGALCVDFPRCRTGNDFIPTSLGSLASQHPMHRAQQLQTMAALGGLHGLTASSAASQSYDRSVPKLIPLCPSQNNTTAASTLSQELGLSELHRLGLAAGATANFLLPPSCAGAMGMPLSKQLGERYPPIPPHGYPKENACPCCPPTGLPIPCACCVPKQSSSRGTGAFTAYTDACCPPKEMPFAMSALYNGGFTSGLSSSGKDKESMHVKSASKESRHAKRDSSSFSTSSASISGIKGSSSSSTVKEAVSVVVSKEASFPMTSSSSSSSLVNRSTTTTSTSSSTTTTLTSSTTSTATSLPIDTHHHSHPHHVAHHAFQTTPKIDSRVLEGCARTDGRDKRSMTLAQKEMESAKMARTSNDISSSSAATTISTATTISPSINVTKSNRIYAPLASIPTVPGDKDSIIINNISRVEPKPLDINVQNSDINNSVNCTITTTTSPNINNGCETIANTSQESSRPEPPHPSTGSDAHMLSVAPFPDEFRRPVVIDAVIYPPRDTLHVNGLPAVPKDSHSPAKAEEIVRKHPGVVTVWRPGNWDDEPPKYPSPSPKEAVVPSIVKDKGAPVPMSPRGASLPEEAREPEVTSSESSVAEPIKSESAAVNVSPEEQVLSAEYGPSALLPSERKLSVVEELVQKYRKKYVENRMLQRLLVNIKRPKPPTCNLPYLIADKKNIGKRKSDLESATANKRFKVIWNDAEQHHKMESESTPYLNQETMPAASIDHVPMMYPVQDDTNTTLDSDKHNDVADRKHSKSRRFDGIWKKRHERIQKIIIKMRSNNNNNGNSGAEMIEGDGQGNNMDNFATDPVQNGANPGDFSIEKEHYESNAVLDNTEKLIVRLYYGRRRFGFHRRRYRSGFDYIRPKKKSIKKYAYEAHPKHLGRLADARFNAEYHISDKDAKMDQSKMKLVSSSPGRSPSCVPLEMKRLMINKTLGETVLHRAARQGYTEVVLYCLETKYVEIDSKDNAGYTPLHECCARGHLQIARYLLQYGADVNASAAGGIRPIHDAVENDRVEVVRLLLSYGADPLLATYSGLTPIKIAHSQTMLELLKGFLADVTGETTEKVQPWQFNGSARCFDSPETGYDVFDDLPSDSENDDRDDITFEISDRPHIQTYLLNHGSPSCHGPETYCLLDDVLRKIGQSREHFLHYHGTAHVISLPRSEFLQSIENSQLVGDSDSLLGDVFSLPNDVNPPVEMVKLDDALRHLLGVETVVIPTHE